MKTFLGSTIVTIAYGYYYYTTVSHLLGIQILQKKMLFYLRFSMLLLMVMFKRVEIIFHEKNLKHKKYLFNQFYFLSNFFSHCFLLNLIKWYDFNEWCSLFSLKNILFYVLNFVLYNPPWSLVTSDKIEPRNSLWFLMGKYL